MQVNQLVEKKAKVEAEISSLERRLQELADETDSIRDKLNSARGGLAILNELEAEHTNRSTETLLQLPEVTLRQAIHDAAGALKQFTRPELQRWIQSKYPQMRFKARSLYTPLEDLVTAGKLVMLRRNSGNKVPAVYGFKESAEEQRTTDPASQTKSVRQGTHGASRRR